MMKTWLNQYLFDTYRQDNNMTENTDYIKLLFENRMLNGNDEAIDDKLIEMLDPQFYDRVEKYWQQHQYNNTYIDDPEIEIEHDQYGFSIMINFYYEAGYNEQYEEEEWEIEYVKAAYDDNLKCTGVT